MELYKAEQLAWDLMSKYHLPALGYGFDFMNSTRSFGRCRWGGEKMIWLSIELTLLNDEAEVLDTILHEIAHALTPGQHHNSKWKKMCVLLGCRPERCYTDEHVVSPPSTVKYRFVGSCPNGHIHFKRIKPRKKNSCGICCPKKYNEQYLVTYKPNE